MANERIVIEIDADTGAITKSFKKLAGKADKAGKKVGDEFGDGFSKSTSRALGSVKGKLLALAGVAGGLFAAKAAVAASAEFQQIQTRLETLTGSAKAASIVFEQLKDFSAKTPFQLKDIANASTKLISFGFSAGTVRDKIEEIGEVAAGSGASLGDLALIYGQVGAAGKLTGERLLQLQERAIPIGAAIADSMGVAESAVKDLVTAGKVTDAEFQRAFKSMASEGGLFAGSLEKQSKTLSGVFSTLADNAKLFSATLGDTFSGSIIDGATSLIGLFQSLGAVVKENGPIIEKFSKSMIDFLVVTPSKYWQSVIDGTAGMGIASVTSEMQRLEHQFALIEADYKKQKDNAFSKFIGADQESLGQMSELIVKITDLAKLRDKLVAQDKTIASIAKDENRKFGVVDPAQAQLELDAAKKQEALKAAAISKAQSDSLIALGATGLTKQQMIEEQLAQELLLIQSAEETKAIIGSEADQRRIVALENANKQILALKKTAKTAETQASKTAKNINKSMNQALGNGVANGIESMTNSLLKGEASFKSFGKMVLTMAAEMAIQVGKIMVATGIAQQAVLMFPGAPAILAGAALIVAGTVAKSLLGGGGGGASVPSSGGGVASSSFSGGGDESAIVAQTEEREDPSTQVSVTIQGDVLDSQETGTRIVSIINDAFEKDGVVIRGAQFA